VIGAPLVWPIAGRAVLLVAASGLDAMTVLTDEALEIHERFLGQLSD
jgi:hypothetical protein